MQKQFKFMFLVLFVLLSTCLFILRDKKILFERQGQALKNNYECKVYNAGNYLDDVSNLLAKVELAKIPRQNIIFFAQIWRSATVAHDNLSSLPYENDLLAKILKYLSQTGDFCYAMLNKSIEEKNLSDDEWQKVNKLKNYAQDLNHEVNKFLNQNCLDEKICWNSLLLKNDYENQKKFSVAINDVNKKFQDYGELIYDGAFSDHIKNMKPKMLIDKKQINKLQAKNIVKKIFASNYLNNLKEIMSVDEINKKNMSVYVLDVIDDKDQKFYFEITKSGGYLLLMLGEPKETKLDNKLEVKQGIKIAKEFLNANNFFDMQENYYEETENYLTINFAPVKDNIIYYSDLIKVKIDLYNKQIIGLESLGYLNMHCERKKDFLNIESDLMDNLLPDSFEKINVKECVIPLETMQEAFCYEITGIYKQEKFLVYINQENGRLEKIYKLFENERGVIVE